MKQVLVAALTMAACASAQTAVDRTSATPFSDPANLRGERVKPTDGRELPVDTGARGLEQMLRRLNTRASLMLIVAHPDDEDGGMLTYVSRGLGARTAMLTLTRGEGGQNAMTGDFEDALGLLRTQELLAAGRYSGVDQMFGTEVDFGFSKTKEEAFGKWTHQRVLYDAVRAVRLYRPLVIAAVFIGGVTDGHGQHQVSGEIAQEVFKAAGDPKIFPELTHEGILPWQPLKVYARVPQGAITSQGLFDYATGQYTPARFTNYVTGEVSTTPPSADVIVHEGQEDSLLRDPGASSPIDTRSSGAHSYVQFARIGLGLQKSQIGPGVRMAPAGAFDISYHRYGTRLAAKAQKQQEETFFEGIDTSLLGIASLAPKAPASLHEGLGEMSAAVKAASAEFKASDPGAIAPRLANALRTTDSLLASLDKGSLPPEEKASILHELRVKRVQLNEALTLALGLSLKANAAASDAPVAVPSSAEAVLAKRGEQSVLIRSLVSGSAHPQAPAAATARPTPAELRWLHGDGGADSLPYSSRAPCDQSATRTVTRPYFYRDGPEEPVYKLSDSALRNAPSTPAPFTCVANLSYNGVPLTLAAVALQDGQPVNFVPPVSLSLSSRAQVMPTSEHASSLTATVSGNAVPSTPAALSLRATDGWSATPASTPLRPGSTNVMVTPPGPRSTPATRLSAEAKTATSRYTESFRPVGYNGLPRTQSYTPAVTRIVPVDLKLPAPLRLGYLPGTGDAVADSLKALGLPSTQLSVGDLTADKLAQFDTVLIGVRAYSAHPDLHGAPTQALLDFARRGGNVVLQYQTAEFTATDAPYPLTLGRDAEKVVDEAAGVQLLDSASPLLATPNRINTADFGGWIEERGHGFLRTWDPRYAALTETHDPGQEPQRGGLVTVQLGQGRWTYLAYALYRQMPEAVPGSFRLMVNLLAPAPR